MRRILIILASIALISATFWWFNRPQPIVVALVKVGLGKVEASLANARAGSVEACQRTRLYRLVAGVLLFWASKRVITLKKPSVIALMER